MSELTKEQDMAIKFIVAFVNSNEPTKIQIDMAIMGAEQLCRDPNFNLSIDLGPVGSLKPCELAELLKAVKAKNY